MVRGLLVGLSSRCCRCFLPNCIFIMLFIIIYSVLLTSILFSLGGFINAVFAKSFDDISIVPTFVLTPLTYLGGVFYSIDNLSPFFQTVSLFNPIVYMVNTFRYGILGVSDVPWLFVELDYYWYNWFIFYALRLLTSGRGMKE
jgi:ABC-2 type transport system permease protein